MIPREATKSLKKLAHDFPVVTVTGPRQSGKTTLVRACFVEKPYVSLEELDQRDFATQDPRGFLSQFKNGAILDEVQRCPDLFSYLQSIVDKDKRAGLFILTGSQQFGLLSKISQSLAGRVGLLSLLPFDLHELYKAKATPSSIESVLFKGMYPPLYDRKIDPILWYENYIRTYIERDVRQLINVRDLANFQKFVRICAARTGQLVNFTGIGNDCGIDHTTAKAWLSVLEASYLVHLLPPHFNNFNKRLIKSAKLYFIDTGLACRLLGIQTAAQLVIHPYRGPLFETWAVSELLKMRFNKGLSSNLYFWQDQSGNEVDVLIDQAGTLVPIEIKSGQTITADFFKGLHKWNAISGQDMSSSCLIYGGKKKQNRNNTHVFPWTEIGSIKND